MFMTRALPFEGASSKPLMLCVYFVCPVKMQIATDVIPSTHTTHKAAEQAKGVETAAVARPCPDAVDVETVFKKPDQFLRNQTSFET